MPIGVIPQERYSDRVREISRSELALVGPPGQLLPCMTLDCWREGAVEAGPGHAGDVQICSSIFPYIQIAAHNPMTLLKVPAILYLVIVFLWLSQNVAP